MKRKAFTLIELLVIVAIISLLIAIILPVIRGRAATTVEYRGNGVYLVSNYGYDASGALSQFKSDHPDLRVVSWQNDPMYRYRLIINTEPAKRENLQLEKP